MTPTHTKPKGHRELYQSRPTAFPTRNLFAYEKETVRLVNEAHAQFWADRGFTKPPKVSKDLLGVFELPVKGGM